MDDGQLQVFWRTLSESCKLYKRDIMDDFGSYSDNLFAEGWQNHVNFKREITDDRQLQVFWRTLSESCKLYNRDIMDAFGS